MNVTSIGRIALGSVPRELGVKGTHLMAEGERIGDAAEWAPALTLIGTGPRPDRAFPLGVSSIRSPAVVDTQLGLGVESRSEWAGACAASASRPCGGMSLGSLQGCAGGPQGAVPFGSLAKKFRSRSLDSRGLPGGLPALPRECWTTRIGVWCALPREGSGDPNDLQHAPPWRYSGNRGANPQGEGAETYLEGPWPRGQRRVLVVPQWLNIRALAASGARRRAEPIEQEDPFSERLRTQSLLGMSSLAPWFSGGLDVTNYSTTACDWNSEGRLYVYKDGVPVEIQSDDYSSDPWAFTPVVFVSAPVHVDGEPFEARGSGTLIDARFALTASHVAANMDWDSIEESSVVARKSGVRFASPVVDYVRSGNFKTWRDWDRDWAVVKTRYRLGPFATMLMSRGSSATLLSRTPNLQGYPGTPDFNQCNEGAAQYQSRFGKWGWLDDTGIAMDITHGTGFSGGPLVTSPAGKGSQRFVAAIHSAHVVNVFLNRFAGMTRVKGWYDHIIAGMTDMEED